MRALQHQRKSSVAVILNANAKRVTPRVQARLERECEGIDVYYSRSLDEGRRIARQVIDNEYDTILTGGGDGTIIQTINSLYKLTGRIESAHEPAGGARHLRMVPQSVRALPAVGILKLGTGNALATVVGASRYFSDAERVRIRMEEGLELPRMSLPMMQAEEEVSPFSGLGWDAAVLNDYNDLKDRFPWWPAQPVCKSVAGYLIAALGVTGPRMTTEQVAEVEVIARAPAALLNADGSIQRQYSRGDLLYRGPVNMAAFATIPYYGYKFKLFPFAEGLKGRFQLRLVTTPISEVVAHLPQIWAGTYRSPRLLDFHCEAVSLSFNRPMPYHVGGDARGMRESLEVGMNPHDVELVDYRTALVPTQSRVFSLIPGLSS